MLIRVIENRVDEVSNEDSCSNDIRFVEVEVEYLVGYDIFVPGRPGAMNDMGCVDVLALM